MPGKWKALLDGLGTFRPVTRAGLSAAAARCHQGGSCRLEIFAARVYPGFHGSGGCGSLLDSCLVPGFCTGTWISRAFFAPGNGHFGTGCRGTACGRRQRVCILALGAGSSASDAPGSGRKRAGYRGGGRPAASGTVPGNGSCVGCGKRCIGTHCPEAWLYTGGTIYSVGAADLRATERYKKVQKEK